MRSGERGSCPKAAGARAVIGGNDNHNMIEVTTQALLSNYLKYSYLQKKKIDSFFPPTFYSISAFLALNRCSLIPNIFNYH